jgi:hypothetical protein
MRITIVAECHRADECHDTQLQLLQPLDLRELTVQLDGSAISGAEIADPSGLRSDPARRVAAAARKPAAAAGKTAALTIYYSSRVPILLARSRSSRSSTW